MFSYVEKKLQIALTDSPHPPKRMTVKDVVQSLSCVHLFLTPWALALQTSLSFTISRSLLKFISIVLVVLSNHLILCRPPLLLPSAFPSIRVFSNESAHDIRWLNYWSFGISPPDFSPIPTTTWSHFPRECRTCPTQLTHLPSTHPSPASPAKTLQNCPIIFAFFLSLLSCGPKCVSSGLFY